MRRSAPLGLRSSVTVAFAAGALLLSAVLAAGHLLRRPALPGRPARAHRRRGRRSPTRRSCGTGCSPPGRRSSDVLGDVSAPAADSDIVVHRGGPLVLLVPAGRDGVPSRRARSTRSPGRRRWAGPTAADGPALVVGVPLPAVGAEFYEVSTPTELRRTLRTLRLVLVGFAVLTADRRRAARPVRRIRRVVAPLDDVAAAAARIAVGELSTRLPSTDDPDLAVHRRLVQHAWSRRWTNGSSATPGSPPTSATSCARR